jgi:predicted metallo-beta-lactamase superfamily hydrolase
MAIEGDIQAVLAPLVAGCCYPLVAPDSQPRPYIIYQVISNVITNSLDGDVGISNRRFQIDPHADTYAAAKVLAKSITDAMASASFTNIKLHELDLYEPEIKAYRVTMDFSVWAAS